MKARPTWPGLVASISAHPRQMRALSAYRFDASRMTSVTRPTLLLIDEEDGISVRRQSIAELRESMPKPIVVVLERQEHNAMDGGRDVLANAIRDGSRIARCRPAVRAGLKMARKRGRCVLARVSSGNRCHRHEEDRSAPTNVRGGVCRDVIIVEGLPSPLRTLFGFRG